MVQIMMKGWTNKMDITKMMKVLITTAENEMVVLAATEPGIYTAEKMQVTLKTGMTETESDLKGVDSCCWCVADAVCEAGFNDENGLILRPELQDAQYMGIHRHCEFWCKPVFGEKLSELPNNVQAVLMRSGEKYLYIMPLCGSDCKTDIRGCAEGGMEFVMFTNCSGYYEYKKQPAFIWAVGDEPLALAECCARAAVKLLNNGLKLRGERRLPDVFKYIGWCSWDALQIFVSEDGLAEKADEFKAKNVPIHYAIIDDMWAEIPGYNEVPRDIAFGPMMGIMHQSKMYDFRGDPRRFPNGMEGAVDALKKRGIKHVGVWFPTTGYWAGLVPEGPLAEQQRENLVQIENGNWIVAPEKSKAYAFFHELGTRVRSWGADFVKIDNQGMHKKYKGITAIGKSARAITAATEGIAGAFFDSAMINCMGMPSECMFNRTNSAVSRCSCDFIPESAEWFHKNILECAFNGVLQGRFYYNDWDMWWTDDGQALKNSVCRAISGGPVYVSDKIGRTNPEVLQPLMLDDGRLLLCDDSAVPAKDCLLEDPAENGKIFKVINRVGDGAMAAVFNLDAENKAVCGTLTAKELGLEGECFVVYEYFTGECRKITGEECVEIQLADNAVCRLYTVIPCGKDFTIIGRIDKFISHAAIVSQALDVTTLMEGGKLGIVSEKPIRVFTENGEAAVERDGILNTVVIARNETAVKIVVE